MVVVGRLAVLLCLEFGPGLAWALDAESVAQPAFRAGDSWVQERTTEKGSSGFAQVLLDMVVERVDGETMVVGLKRDGAPGNYEDQVVGTDWSHHRVLDGDDTVTVRPMKFPLRVGKTWSIDYTDNAHRGRQMQDHVRRTYKVVGWEDVTVPAGTFRAVKVEANGVDDAVVSVPNRAGSTAMSTNGAALSVSGVQRGGLARVTRRTYAALYYVPEVKNWVKAVEEQYNTDVVLVLRETTTLMSWKPGA